MRAFRPSRFGMLEEAEADPAEAIERTVKIRVYARRAKAQKPLFQEEVESEAPVGRTED